MRRKTASRMRRASNRGFFIFLLLALLTGGLILAKPTHAFVESEYSEPARGEPVLGLSIGNSYSSAGLKNGSSAGNIEIIPGGNGHFTIPSLVSFTESGKPLVGEEALSLFETHPERSVTGFKRLLGRTFDEVQDLVMESPYQIIDRGGMPEIVIPIASGDITISPTNTTAMIIKQLKAMADEYMMLELNHTVITVPATFNDRQRQAVKDAASIAGLNALRVVNEPTAASLAYNLDKDNMNQYYRDERFVLVHNLDGSTFDTTVLLIEDGVFEVLSVDRIENISNGRVDWESTYLPLPSQDEIREEKEERKAHDLFLLREENQIPLGHTGVRAKAVTTRGVEVITSFEPKHIEQSIERAIRDANITYHDITDTVFAGDVSRIPKLQSVIENYHDPRVQIHKSIDPALVTTHGAAIQGAILADYNEDICCCIDVNSLGFGVETLGGIMTHMVRRGTTIPTKKSRLFTTVANNQTSVVVKVFMGERGFVANNSEIGILKLDDIPPSPQGIPKFEVVFQLEWNHTLTASLIDRDNNNSDSFTLHESQYRVDQDVVETLVEEYEMFMDEERALRQQVEELIALQGEHFHSAEAGAIMERIWEEPIEHKPDLFERIANLFNKFW